MTVLVSLAIVIIKRLPMIGYFINPFINFCVMPMPTTLEDSLAIANKKQTENAMVIYKLVH
jgi:hypothetical protein